MLSNKTMFLLCSVVMLLLGIVAIYYGLYPCALPFFLLSCYFVFKTDTTREKVPSPEGEAHTDELSSDSGEQTLREKSTETENTDAQVKPLETEDPEELEKQREIEEIKQQLSNLHLTFGDFLVDENCSTLDAFQVNEQEMREYAKDFFSPDPLVSETGDVLSENEKSHVLKKLRDFFSTSYSVSDAREVLSEDKKLQVLKMLFEFSRSKAGEWNMTSDGQHIVCEPGKLELFYYDYWIETHCYDGGNCLPEDEQRAKLFRIELADPSIGSWEQFEEKWKNSVARELVRRRRQGWKNDTVEAIMNEWISFFGYTKNLGEDAMPVLAGPKLYHDHTKYELLIKDPCGIKGIIVISISSR